LSLTEKLQRRLYRWVVGKAIYIDFPGQPIPTITVDQAGYDTFQRYTVQWVIWLLFGHTLYTPLLQRAYKNSLKPRWPCLNGAQMRGWEAANAV